MPRPSYGLVHMQFNFFVACGGLFSVLLLHSSFSFVRLFRSHLVRLFLSSDFSVRLCSSFLLFRLFRSYSILFSVLLSARHLRGGGVFRQQGNFSRLPKLSRSTRTLILSGCASLSAAKKFVLKENLKKRNFWGQFS